MTPNGIQQLIPGQQFSGPRDHLRQYGEYLWLERVLRAAFPENAVCGIELAVPAAIQDLVQADLPSSASLIPHESLMIIQGSSLY